jgi:TolB-like protein/Flp pilus assembly protein TadD
MQAESGGARVVRFGVFELDTQSGELRRQGVRVKLQEQPFRILEMLLANPGQLVTREEVRRRLWPSNSFVDFDQGLNKAINKLREALGDSAESPRFIETLAKRGYRFLGEIRAEERLIRSLLVLPLENLSRDPEQEYFADGLTEALITYLAKISALRVVSRTTAMVYKGIRKPLPEIAHELNIEGVVEGTVMRAEGRARISAQLVHAPTDTHLWAEIYDRDLRDIMALQMEVATAIVREVQVKLTPHEQSQLADPRPVDPEVYETYLKGRYHWNKRTLVGMSKGAEYFQQAIDKDPLYAAAYAGLADSAARLGWWGYVSPQEGCARAIAVATKGLTIDDTLAEAHAALCFALLHHDYAFQCAEEEGRRAVAFDPKNALAAQALACCLTVTARLDEGVNEALRAAQLEPLSPISQWIVGGLLYHARQYDQALAYCRKCLELDPDFHAAKMLITWILLKTSDTESRVAELEVATRATGGNHNFLGTLGYCYAARQRPEEARKILSQLEEAAKQRYIPTLWPAVIHGSLGEMDTAFRLLQKAHREHVPWIAYIKVAPFCDDLRTDPRFEALLRRMNFPP